MSDFDVIVVGGGPAGGYAALAAASRGLKTVLFEEHPAIGWPRHDPGWLMECDFSKSIIKSLGKIITWYKTSEYRVIKAETGEQYESSPLGGFMVRRDMLEKEVAARAAKAGCAIYLKTKVNSLTDGGVQTNSPLLPRATAKIIICADGIRSSESGLALKEEMCRKGDLRPGISMLLSNADVTGGVIEHFVSADEPILNYRCFFTHTSNASYLSIPTEEGFFGLKLRTDNAVSRKIQKAYPVESSGYARASSGKYGAYFKKIVKDNIMFIGDASGGAGNIHGMIQGHFAGMVAAAAIKENDTSEKRLMEYQDMVYKTLVKAPFAWHSAREDFGTFHNWFREFESATRGIQATELA